MVKKKSSRAISKKTSHANNKIVLVAFLFTAIGALGLLAVLTISTQPPAGAELAINETTEPPTNLVGGATKCVFDGYEDRKRQWELDGEPASVSERRTRYKCQTCWFGWCGRSYKQWDPWRPYAY